MAGKDIPWGGAANEYSTTEKVVGTWIDGKPLYQKTVDCGALPNKTEKTVAYGISNLGYVVSIDGFATNLTNHYALPFITSTGSDQVVVSVNATNIRVTSASDRSNITTSYVTLQYTKTTD